ncbi:MAG TPA: 50S ribosomal protein L25 [Chloroflexota bacterium]|jgi:large subunit ribosomal protein L25|nr:50S ribosomal protein L25 [Chloroflexota bacterium]
MAHTIDLDVEPRSILGKKVKRLRRVGYVPANLYGHGVRSTALQVEAKRLEGILKHATATTLINLRIGDARQRRSVLVRDVRYSVLRHEPEHVDFFAIRMDEPIRAAVPIVFRGEAPAARNADHMILHPVTTVNVSGLPTDLPEAIAVDVSGLAEVDDTIHARDLHLPENVQLLDDPDEIIAKVQLVRAALVEEPVAPEAPAGEAPAEGERAAAETPQPEGQS